MTREIHFFADFVSEKDWERNNRYDLSFTYYEHMEIFLNHIREDPRDIICTTTQMSFLSTEWFERGFRIFVHDCTGTFEIVLGEGNERTTREIRYAHNLFRLWENGEFGRFDEEVEE